MGTPEVVLTSPRPPVSPPGSARASARATTGLCHGGVGGGPNRTPGGRRPSDGRLVARIPDGCLESAGAGSGGAGTPAGRHGRSLLSATRLEFGVYLNNRGPLLSRDWTLADLLELATAAEVEGFDSVWVGDGLLAEPRHDPLMVLGALAVRTSRVRLGTACLRVSARDPLYLAMAWSTIDRLSGGRTILGACAGNAMEEGVRREFAVQGLDPRDRVGRLEEAVQVLRQLWTTGRVDFVGRHFRYEGVSFSSGTEVEPLRPLQTPPPIWIVSNPHLGGADPEAARAATERAARRIVRYADGWLTCCRATHPEEVEAQLGAIREAAADAGRPVDDLAVGYQTTMVLADSVEEARASFARFIAAYHPAFGPSVDLADWGPVGTPDHVGGWIRRFADAGVNRFLFRLGSTDPIGDVRRFARDVLPAFRDGGPVAP
jgi:alkanesulfonate monooxygenase SsuD/methylene tetrahydromethanopterin reductase-like flavin-dependent oxidoreductase (luciferase family)